MKKGIGILVIAFITLMINFSTINAATATYFCCKENKNAKCHTTDGQIWHSGDYTPCGSTPCTTDKCAGKKVADSDGIIEDKIFVSFDGTINSGIGYINITLYYDDEVQSGDFHTSNSTLEFNNYVDWINYVISHP